MNKIISDLRRRYLARQYRRHYKKTDQWDADFLKLKWDIYHFTLQTNELPEDEQDALIDKTFEKAIEELDKRLSDIIKRGYFLKGKADKLLGDTDNS